MSTPRPPQFGYEQGQWGKPPVDMMGRPLYGDVFGNWYQHMNQAEQQVDKSTKVTSTDGVAGAYACVVKDTSTAV